MGVSNSPFVKYWHAIKASPPGIYNRRLFLTVFVYALAGSPRGWDEGSTSAVTQLKSFQREFGITPTGNPDAVSNIVSFVNLTAGLGALLSFLINDRVGRRWSLRIYITIVAIGTLISTFSYGSLAALYVGRLVSGLGIGALTVTGPMSIVEIAPRVTRGLMTLWFNIAMLSSQMIGIFVVYGANTNIPISKNLQWQTPFFVQTFIPAIAIGLSFLVDESPRWLCLKGRTDEAINVLARIRGFDMDSPHLLAEFDSINTPIQRELSEYGQETLLSTLRETFFVRSNLRRVQLTIVAYILAQMSGANSITNYLPTIFGYIGLKNDDAKIYSSGLYAFVKLFCCILASLFFVDAIGRRKSLFIGITIQMFCHIYLGAFLNVTGSGKLNNSHADAAAIAAIYIHALGWAVGLYSLPYLFGAELWPNRIRSFGGALSQCFHWLFLFAITKATPALLSSMDKWGAFIFFAAWCLIALVYCFIMVPETSGRTLESMDRLFEHRWYEMRKYAYEKSSPSSEEKLDADVEHAEIQHVSDK
ncbi:general substrate transporter [Hypoxylon trugodes]|uniref:general substrate transporter n=1 Tax=Hypoxylon trugodes TaxID=326681 RepID=UPI002195A6EC|nr:general substrate transporter [Hypoxylon trugodes]KAI1387021.1 general substrate transporter [Hypoxylon trugodes]